MDLEYFLESNKKVEQINDENFEIQEQNLQKVTKDKIGEYEQINQQIVNPLNLTIQKDLEKKTEEEPLFKIEQEKNLNSKKKLEVAETQLLDLTSKVEVLEMSNDHLIKKKEEVISIRKKLINQNDELKREIESKNAVNELRIQRKVKENNSEEIQKLEAHLQSIKDTIAEVNVRLIC